MHKPRACNHEPVSQAMALPLAEPLSVSASSARGVRPSAAASVCVGFPLRPSIVLMRERESRRVNKTSMQPSCIEEYGARPVIIRPSTDQKYSIMGQIFRQLGQELRLNTIVVHHPVFKVYMGKKEKVVSEESKGGSGRGGWWKFVWYNSCESSSNNWDNKPILGAALTRIV